MATFTTLDQVEEDKLHATRLLGIEERPLKRVTKRLLASNTPILSFLNRSRDAPSETAVEIDTTEEHQKFLKDLQRFRDDVIMDFAAFETSIARIQFLHAANEKERGRYAAEKLKIEATAEDVRENTSSLRIQLDETQKTLAVRKTYDILADKITKNAALKPRDEQHGNVEKLKAEIEELERESQELSQAWVDRRDQFAKMVDEGARLRRLVRNEKEPEEDEEENDEENHDEERLGVVGRERDPGSNVGTPRPTEDAPTPLPALNEAGASTPRSTVPGGGSDTPLPDGMKEHTDVEMGEEGLANEDSHSHLKISVTADEVNDDMDLG